MDIVEVKNFLNKFPLKLLNTLAVSYQQDELLSFDDVYQLKQDIEQCPKKQ